MRIGLPKGVVKHLSEEIIRQMAGSCFRSGQLSHAGRDGDAWFLLKHRDVPTLIRSGHLDFGITSSEWLVESGAALHVISRLDWCNTKISVIGEPHTTLDAVKSGDLRCVTEFPNIAKRYLRKLGILEPDVTHISGSCEALVPRVFDFGIDCVETGATLKANGLVEIDSVLTSQVVLVSAVARDVLAPTILKKLDRLLGELCV